MHSLKLCIRIIEILTAISIVVLVSGERSDARWLFGLIFRRLWLRIRKLIVLMIIVIWRYSAVALVHGQVHRFTGLED